MLIPSVAVIPPRCKLLHAVTDRSVLPLRVLTRVCVVTFLRGELGELTCQLTVAPKHARKHETHPPRVKKEEEEFRLHSNDCSFICAGVNFVGGYK